MQAMWCWVRAWTLVALFAVTACGGNSWGEQSSFSTESVAEPCSSAGLSAAAVERLLQLSDTTTLEGADEVDRRVDEIAALFSACGDPRGLFPVVYRPITRRAVDGLAEGQWGDSPWAERLVVAFAARYFDALHASLEGGPVAAHWARYDALANDVGTSRLRVVAMGVAAHLVVDLPEALVDADTSGEHHAGYEFFGEELVTVTPALIDDLAATYAVDASGLFGGFFLGDWVDAAFGTEVTTTFMFQAIRGKAWRNRWLIQHGFGAVARAEIAASFHTLDGVLAGIDVISSPPR